MLKSGKEAYLISPAGEAMGTFEVQGTIRGIAIICRKGQMLTFDMATGAGVESSEGYTLSPTATEPNLGLVQEIVKNLAHGAASETVSDSAFRTTAKLALQNILNEFNS